MSCRSTSPFPGEMMVFFIYTILFFIRDVRAPFPDEMIFLYIEGVDTFVPSGL